MNPQERFAVTCAWNAVCVAGSIYYLSGSVVRALVIGVFVYFSSLLGYGMRWLLRGGFALTILACAVGLGFPPPDQWYSLIKAAWDSLTTIRTSFLS